MSFLDDIRTKAEELFGGASEQVGSNIEDATNQVSEITDQAQNAKDVLSGQDSGSDDEQ